jgi:serine/threonine-protein kinase HipA
MDREIEVHIDWDGATRPVGRLWARAKGARQTCSFAYDQA